MKSGVRALGIAESFRDNQSTLCGAVTTTVGVVDGFAFCSCQVGGHNATSAMIDLWENAGRPDIRFVFLNGVALAWYNIVDMQELADRVPVPVLALTFEESSGLEAAISEHFSGEERQKRLDRYRALPARRRMRVNGETIFVRACNAEDIDVEDVVARFTPAGARPEPIRVARLAARAADRWQRGVC